MSASPPTPSFNARLSPEEFEQQVERILRVLEKQTAEINWNKHLPDVEVEGLERQVDILINNDGKRTMVECRHRRAPQDVTWIEQLDGKRRSLGLDAIIAVSSSGFSTGAIQKAKARGIVVRNLSDIKPEEVKTWTNFKKMSVNFIKFEDVKIDVYVQPRDAFLIKNPTDLAHAKDGSNPIFKLFDNITSECGDEIFDKGQLSGSYSICSEDLRIDKRKVQRIDVTLRAIPFSVEKEVLFAAKFIEPSSEVVDPLAIIEKIDASKTELISGLNAVLWTIDLSSVQPGKNCVFHDYRVDSVYINRMMKIEIVGTDVFCPFGTIESEVLIRTTQKLRPNP